MAGSLALPRSRPLVLPRPGQGIKKSVEALKEAASKVKLAKAVKPGSRLAVVGKEEKARLLGLVRKKKGKGSESFSFVDGLGNCSETCNCDCPPGNCDA